MRRCGWWSARRMWLTGCGSGCPAYADAWPGRVTEVPVLVRAARRWFGRPEPRVFAVIAEAPKPLAATRLAGTRVVSPLLPGWVPPVAGVVAVAAVAAAVVIPRLHLGHGTSGQSSPPAAASAVVATTPVTMPDHSTPGQSTPGQSAPDKGTPGDSTPGNGNSLPASPPSAFPVNLISAASSATWTSVLTGGPAPTGTPTSTPTPAPSASTALSTGSGCQSGTALTTASQGIVYTDTQTELEDETLASTVLETDPPEVVYASIQGLYTFLATPAGESFFRAQVGFCWGSYSADASEYVAVTEPGLSQPLWQDTLFPSNQLTSISVPLSAGTTQLELVVQNTQSSTADVVWWDPRVEAQNAAQPSTRPTVTPTDSASP